MRETIRTWDGQIIGYIDTNPNGDKEARNFYGRILGRYEKNLNVTRNFYGVILTSGDTVSSLIYEEYNKNGGK